MSDVDLLFEQVAKAWPQGVHRDSAFSMPASFGGGVDGAIELSCAEVPGPDSAGEQPAAVEHLAPRPGDAPPDTQPLKAVPAKAAQRSFGSCTLLDAQGHALAVDVTNLSGRLTSLTRSPVAYASANAVWCFRLPAAAIRRRTFGLRITGSWRGRWTGCIWRPVGRGRG